MYYPATAPEHPTRFRNAVLLACAVHAALIFSISFGSGAERPYVTPQIEVTLAIRPDAFAPDDARHIAAADQQGSGDEADITQLSAQNPVQSEEPADQLERMPLLRELEQPTAVLGTTAPAERKTVKEPLEQVSQPIELDGIHPEIDRISQQIADLQAELLRESSNMAEEPRVRRLSAASARQSVDAAYLMDWRRRLEAVGNQYYPQASVRYGLYGDLRMLVVVRADGSLEDIRILSSSGYAVLDEAAIKIVRMAAPFAPFPPELRATTDKLEIVRTWHFQENPLSSP